MDPFDVLESGPSRNSRCFFRGHVGFVGNETLTLNDEKWCVFFTMDADWMDLNMHPPEESWFGDPKEPCYRVIHPSISEGPSES